MMTDRKIKIRNKCSSQQVILKCKKCITTWPHQLDLLLFGMNDYSKYIVMTIHITYVCFVSNLDLCLS